MGFLLKTSPNKAVRRTTIKIQTVIAYLFSEASIVDDMQQIESQINDHIHTPNQSTPFS